MAILFVQLNGSGDSLVIAVIALIGVAFFSEAIEWKLDRGMLLTTEGPFTVSVRWVIVSIIPSWIPEIPP